MATMSEYIELQADVERLRKVEAAALRVASSRRDGVVTDVGALNRLDAALEGRADEICDACDKPEEHCSNQHGICSRVGGRAHERPAIDEPYCICPPDYPSHLGHIDECPAIRVEDETKENRE